MRRASNIHNFRTRKSSLVFQVLTEAVNTIFHLSTSNCVPDELVVGFDVHFQLGAVDDGLVATSSLRVDEVMLHHVERTEEQGDEAQTELGRVPEDGPHVGSVDRDQDHLGSED